MTPRQNDTMLNTCELNLPGKENAELVSIMSHIPSTLVYFCNNPRMLGWSNLVKGKPLWRNAATKSSVIV